MAHTIPALFDTYADAERAVDHLEKAGVPHDDISVIANNIEGHRDGARNGEKAQPADGDAVGRDAGAGAGIGGVIGGAGGLLAGLGALAIPGLGPIVALGWLASTAAGAIVGGAVGATAGGIVGALTHAGVSKEDADAYAEGVRRGGTLVTVRVKDDDKLASIQQILSEPTGAVNMRDRRAAYMQQGWSRFDDSAPVFTIVEIENERSRYGRV